jgi:AcrR family transcriptional regulator
LSNVATPGTPERPLRADARRNRERVMEVARAAFAECGSDLSMEELARRAGVGVGTVYRHFPNKDALLDALVTAQVSMLVERTRAALERDDAWEAFRELVRQGADLQAEDLAFCEVAMARKRDSESSDVVAVREELQAETEKLLERAKAEGRLRPDFTIDDVPVMFASIAAAVRLAEGRPEAWKRHVEFTLDGLRA